MPAPARQLILAVLASTVALTSPVHAAVGPPTMSTNASYTTTTASLCASGTLHAPATAPTWTATMSGLRSDGTAITFLPRTGNGTSFSTCFPFTKGANGHATLVFTYSGGGDDRPSILFGALTWIGPSTYPLEMAQ
jgi:hypothetical protein